MTSEPDSTPRRRPPTIDLTAKELETPEPGLAQGSAADAAESRQAHNKTLGEAKDSSFRGRVGSYAVGAIVGALAVGAILAAFWIAGLVPPQRTQAASGAQAAKAAATDEISSRLEKIEQALQAPRADQALVARVAAAEAQTKSVADALIALNHRLDEIAAAQSALAQTKATADGAKNAAPTGVPESDRDALNQRIAALEGAIKSLAAEVAQRTSSADDRTARLAVAAEELRAAVERGTSYQAELAAVRALGADQNATIPLEPLAANGLPSGAALGHELTGLTPSLLQASGAAAGGSFFERLEAHAQKLVRITPKEAPAGDDPASVIARINIDAAHGDIALALAEIARLPAPARAVAGSWVKKAEAREAALAAGRRVAADALAAIGGAAPR